MVFYRQYVKDIQVQPCLGACFFNDKYIRLVIKSIFIFFLYFCITASLSAQNNSGNSENEKKNEYSQIYEKAKFYQNRADSTLKAIRVLRDELSLETNTEGKVLLEKRILNLEKQQKGYQKNADMYLNRARKLKNNIDMKDQQKRLEEISVYSDAFYKLTAVSNLLTAEEWQALYSLEPFYSEGNELMQEITKLKNKKNQLVILTNTSRDRGENEKIKSQIEDLNEQIRNLENKAFISFQKVYHGKYRINSGIINRITRDVEQGSRKIILTYKNNATQSYKRSTELFKEAENSARKEKQFDLLGESNTYVLLAVETQKKAIGTYSGTFSGSFSEISTSFSNPPSYKGPGPDTTDFQDDMEAEQKSSVDTLNYLNQFKITSTDNSEHYTIPVDKPIPDGIIYKIQIGVYRKIPSKTFFKGIWPVTAETIPSSQNLRFLAGLFSLYKDAMPAVDTIHLLGFTDAFIISYHDQKRIPVKEARKIENSILNRKKALHISKTPVPVAKKQPTDRYENVFLTVQIGAFHDKIPAKRMNTILLCAENEPVTIFKNKKDLYVYTIGKFYNFEKTVALKNRLIENGLEGAYVIALSGNQKIRLDEAIQLLRRNIHK